MSFKTRRLVELFPDAYAAGETESLLYKLLDAIGAELMEADERVKQLLKSHWVDYASEGALDGLGAIYGVSRRKLSVEGSQSNEESERWESDETFRQRLKSIVPLFTGGGTRRAVIGAVQSALGLPFDLDQLKLPDEFKDLREDLQNLIRLEEFTPTIEPLVVDNVLEVDNASQLVIIDSIPSVPMQEGGLPVMPTIDWAFTQGAGRSLSVELISDSEGANSLPKGIKSKDEFIIPQGKSLKLSARENGELFATLDSVDVSSAFTNLDGSGSPKLPTVPFTRSKWVFRAKSARFDISVFDSNDTFDLPRFQVEMSWLRRQPLTFDIYVPYHLADVVKKLAVRHHYTPKLFVFGGIPLERIQEVVDQTKAAGVRGKVHFTLNFYEVHEHRDNLTLKRADSLIIGNGDQIAEDHIVRDDLVIGGVFDISPFDGNHGFNE